MHKIIKSTLVPKCSGNKLEAEVEAGAEVNEENEENEEN